MQRKAAQQFAKDHQFKLADGVSGADFVFVAILQADADNPLYIPEELALVVLPDDYLHNRTDLDGLRDRALWRGGGQLRGFGSEIQRLVKQFEQATIGPVQSKSR